MSGVESMPKMAAVMRTYSATMMRNAIPGGDVSLRDYPCRVLITYSYIEISVLICRLRDQSVVRTRHIVSHCIGRSR